MKIIAVEEHFTVKNINDIYTKVLPGDNEMQRAYSKRNTKLASDGILTDLGEHRLAAMDRSGIAVQIIGYGDNAPTQLHKEVDAEACCRAIPMKLSWKHIRQWLQVSSWGNYSNDSFLEGAKGDLTGKWEEAKANNIYDLAGNNWEWTQERYGTIITRM